MNNSLRNILLGASTLAGIFAAHTVRADENFFGYSYGSETLPAGGWEVYQWTTARLGKADGHYQAVDLQTEIEHGFTDRLQGSLYLNGIDHRISGVTGLSDRHRTAWNGLQGSLKYSLSSPYKDGLGVALYLEPGYKRVGGADGSRTDTWFLEPKLIVQKNFLEDTLVWAANLAGEFEREHHREEASWESELELQFSTGLSYRFTAGWFVGAEFLATSNFEQMHLDRLGEYALFAGPTLHYANKAWWATLTVLPQLSGWPQTSGSRELDHFEKLQVRLKLGIDF